MSKSFKFSKGILEVGDSRISGTIKASTSMQQSPANLAIDTKIDKFGPISINEVKQFRFALAGVGFMASIVIGCLVGLFVISGTSGLGDLVESLEKFNYILPISAVVGIVVAIIIFKAFRIYMAQFSNDGQTVYVPFLKKADYPVLEELDTYIREMKCK